MPKKHGPQAKSSAQCQKSAKKALTHQQHMHAQNIHDRINMHDYYGHYVLIHTATWAKVLTLVVP